MDFIHLSVHSVGVGRLLITSQTAEGAVSCMFIFFEAVKGALGERKGGEFWDSVKEALHAVDSVAAETHSWPGG